MLRKWVPLWTIPVIILFAIGTVWVRLTIVRTTYSINEANHEINKMRQEREQLQVKMSALRSPRRLENIARNHFKIGQPRVDQVIHFRTTASAHEP